MARAGAGRTPAGGRERRLPACQAARAPGGGSGSGLLRRPSWRHWQTRQRSPRRHRSGGIGSRPERRSRRSGTAGLPTVVVGRTSPGGRGGWCMAHGPRRGWSGQVPTRVKRPAPLGVAVPGRSGRKGDGPAPASAETGPSVGSVSGDPRHLKTRAGGQAETIGWPSGFHNPKRHPRACGRSVGRGPEPDPTRLGEDDRGVGSEQTGGGGRSRGDREVVLPRRQPPTLPALGARRLRRLHHPAPRPDR